MGRILVHEFISLDGVIEDPRWTMEFGFDPQMGVELSEIMGSSKGILLGRNTYTMFEPAWSTRTVEDDPGAPFFNDTEKYVVSGTLTEATWRNSTLLGAYDPERLRALKQEVDGDIYVSGSAMLVRGMLADRLVDELHLFLFPIALGAGAKLFLEGEEATKLALASTHSYDNGVVRLSYRA